MLWLFGLWNTLSGGQSVEVLVTLWASWYARGQAIHENEFLSPLSTHLFVSRYIEELQGYDFMSDGAVAKSANKGAVAVVCGDEQGVFQGASALVFEGITDPEILEAYACREALALGEDLNLDNLHIASDCLRVIRELESAENLGGHCTILREIRSRRNFFQACQFCREQRDSSGEAHRLS
jgi:hypothetical protein